MSNAFQNSWHRLTSVLTEPEVREVPADVGRDLLSERELQMLAAIPGVSSVHTRNGSLVWSSGAYVTEDSGAFDKDPMEYLKAVNPQDRPALLDAIDRASQSPTHAEVRFRALGKTGHEEHYILELTCAAYTPEQIIFPDPLVIVTARDITGQRLEIEKAKEEARVAKEQLVERNELFAAASHELRTPLNAIIGFSELLEGKASIRLDEVKKLEYAGLINQSANQLLKLINGVLDLSKLEAGKQQIHLGDVDIADLVSSVAKMMEPVAKSKSIDVLVSADEFLPQVHSDEQVLRQVTTNLISNAVKFSDENSRVEIKVQRRRMHLEIHVSDKGIGMAKETIAKLGAAFFQAGASISQDYGGTGLGLAIAFSQMKALGGEIRVESTLGEGSTFTVVVPLRTRLTTPVSAEPSGEVVYLNRELDADQDKTLKLNSGAG